MILYCVLYRNLLVQLGGSLLSEHEIITMARYYSDTRDVKLSLETLVAIVQEQLKKNAFENFAKLQEGFLQHDTDRSGFLDGALVRSTCNAFHLPLPDDLLRALIAR